MPSCVIRGCNNRPDLIGKNPSSSKRITFHRFPVNKKDVMQTWLYAIGANNLKEHIKQIHTTCVICSEHFEERYFNSKTSKRGRLTNDALPTIFNCNINNDEGPIARVHKWILTSEDTTNLSETFETSSSTIIEYGKLAEKESNTTENPENLVTEILSENVFTDRQNNFINEVLISENSSQDNQNEDNDKKKKLKIPSYCFEKEIGPDLPHSVVVKKVVLKSNSKLHRKWDVPAKQIKRRSIRVLRNLKTKKCYDKRRTTINISEFTETLLNKKTNKKLICRICASLKLKTIGIFDADGIRLQMADKINKYLPVEVSKKDNLPLQICSECIEKLEICVELQQCSQDSEAKLRFLYTNEDIEYDITTNNTDTSVEDTRDFDDGCDQIEEKKIIEEMIKYKCKDCNKEIEGIQRYSRHCYTIHKKKKCKGCTEFFNNKEELIKHWIDNHGSKCECCGEKFRNVLEKLSHVRNIHPEFKSYICTYCGSAFNNKYALTIHYECHQSEKLFLCDSCGKCFKSKRRLNVHKCLSSPSKSNINNPTETTFTCKHCGKKYFLKSSLLRHMIIHTGERKYSCDICNKKFYSKEILKNHEVIHIKSTLYQCEMCCARYFHKRNMMYHVKKKHSTPWNYKCPYCPKIFPSINQVIEHKTSHDSDQFMLGIPQEQYSLDFQCRICNKTFENIYLLNVHFEEHVVRNNEELYIKPNDNGGSYTCGLCDEKFASIRTIKTHVRKIHGTNNTENKVNNKHSCEICDKLFSSKVQLKRHLMIHTEKPYKCDERYCKATFRDRNALVIHSRTHTGEMPFVCYICNKKFRSQTVLRVHKATHDKPYSCNYCGLRFARKNIFNKHVDTHTTTTASTSGTNTTANNNSNNEIVYY